MDGQVLRSPVRDRVEVHCSPSRPRSEARVPWRCAGAVWATTGLYLRKGPSQGRQRLPYSTSPPRTVPVLDCLFQCIPLAAPWCTRACTLHSAWCTAHQALRCPNPHSAALMLLCAHGDVAVVRFSRFSFSLNSDWDQQRQGCTRMRRLLPSRTSRSAGHVSDTWRAPQT